ncbi:MAG: SurA N-terminal domain-containing protein [Treponema sp.]|nr:SurA N-terminal domain-containing protein [Treponema sp.]
MKKNTAYTIGSLIILLICAFCFVALPAFTGSGSQQPDSLVFGKYNGKEIKYEQGSDFYNFVSQYGQMFQSQGRQIDSSSYYYIFNYAFNSTVSKYAYTDAVENSGYEVPKAAVNRQMLPYFYDETGKYSSKLYKQTPEATVAEIRRGVEDSLTTSRYYDDNFGSDTDQLGSTALYGIKEASAEVDFLKDYNKTKRGFNMVAFALSDYPEEEKLAFAKENAAKFTKYDLSVITVSDKSTAETVSKRLANNEITFTDAVTEYSSKNYSNTEGKVTSSYQYQVENIIVNKDDLAVIADLAVDAISPAIETISGYSIFKTDSAPAVADFENEEVKKTISSYITNYEKTLIEDYFKAKATDFTNEALKSDFDSACTALGLTKQEIAPFPLNFGSVDISSSIDTSVKGLSYADSNENFLKTAFSLKLNDYSEPLVLNDNIIVLQYTTSETAAEEGPYADSNLKSYDENAAQDFILASDKLENNFTSVYFNNFMNN